MSTTPPAEAFGVVPHLVPDPPERMRDMMVLAETPLQSHESTDQKASR
jgi:hypothetical protein